MTWRVFYDSLILIGWEREYLNLNGRDFAEYHSCGPKCQCLISTSLIYGMKTAYTTVHNHLYLLQGLNCRYYNISSHSVTNRQGWTGHCWPLSSAQAPYFRSPRQPGCSLISCSPGGVSVTSWIHLPFKILDTLLFFVVAWHYIYIYI